jgi:hypothetical protein
MYKVIVELTNGKQHSMVLSYAPDLMSWIKMTNDSMRYGKVISVEKCK